MQKEQNKEEKNQRILLQEELTVYKTKYQTLKAQKASLEAFHKNYQK